MAEHRDDSDTIPQAPAEANDAGEELEDVEGTPPKIDFASFVLSVATNALVSLSGESGDDERIPCGKVELKEAAQHIDILSMLEEKTRGNLSQQEEDLLHSVLYELRMKYVDAAQCVKRAR